MAKADIKKSKKSVSKKQEEKATKASKQKKEESSSSESSSSSSSEESSSDSDSSSDEEEEKKEESSSDSSSSDSSSDEEEEEKKEEKKEESSSDSSDSDSSDDEEEEKKEEKKDESSSSSSSSSDSSDSSDDEEETKEEESSKKRKAEESEESSSSASPEPETKKAKTEEASSSEPATLFIGRLSWNIDDDWLKREFEKYPGVISARVISDRQTGRSKGYGYVDFESKEVADKALEEMQGAEIDGRPINVDISTAKPKTQDRSNDRAKKFGDSKSEPSDTLFIGNLSFDSDRDSVTEFFAEHGPIMGVRLPTHPETEQLKGFGYVQFESVEAAQNALDKLNGEYLNNRAVRLDFSTPKPQNNNGGRGNFGGRGGRGGFGGRGGRDRNDNRGGFRPSGSGANSTPVNSFRGTKRTFD